MNFRRSAAGKPRAGAIPSLSRHQTAAEPAMELERPTPTFHHLTRRFGRVKVNFAACQGDAPCWHVVPLRGVWETGGQYVTLAFGEALKGRDSSLNSTVICCIP